MFKEVSRTVMPQYDGDGIMYVHDRTGMEVFHLKNKSTELCGDFIFSTPSEDSTGCAHILEHTVLCGSERYPVKDPFSQLIISSPNTFLNAMTYTDKTMYPFASPLKKDFDILFSVYADAVFAPLLRRQSFNQEGIRYFESGFDGVVFNEMRGANSSEDSLLENAVTEKLFEGTAAAYDSGGDPKCIPDLTYEEYLKRYRKWYSPSNCRLYLYGDLDAQYYMSVIEERYLGEENLKKWDNKKIIPSPDKYTIKYKTPQRNSVVCPSNTASSAVLSWLVGPSDNPLEVLSLSILVDILLGTPGAPLYKAITESDLGEDLHTNSGMSAHSPYLTFTVGFTGFNKAKIDEVEPFLLKSLSSIAENGLDKDEVEAALRRQEFRLKEIQGSSYPYGLRIAFSMAKFWARGVDPASCMDENALLDIIKDKVSKEPYFENCIKRYFLDNNRRLFTTSSCDPDYDKKLSEFLSSKFQKTVEASDSESLAKYKKDYETFISTNDSPEALSCIQRIRLSDMPDKCPSYAVKKRNIGNLTVTPIPMFTNSIVYLQMTFNTDFLTVEDLEILPILIRLLQMCGTSKEDYVQIGKKTRLLTGDLTVQHNCGTRSDGKIVSFVSVKTKALQEYYSEAVDLIKDIITDADLSDTSRIKDCITDLFTMTEQNYPYSANYYANLYAGSSVSPVFLANDYVFGTRLWLNIKKFKSLDKNGLKDLSVRLTNLRDSIFGQKDITVMTCCSEDVIEENINTVVKSINTYPKYNKVRKPYKLEILSKASSEYNVLTLSSGPSFNARVVDLSTEDDHALVEDMLLASILANGWLWSTVRGKNGAYGVESHVEMQEKLYFCSSYRDPLVKDTFNAYRESLGQGVSKDEIEFAAVSILGRELRPMTPLMYSNEAFRRFMYNMTDQAYETRRKQLFTTTPEDLKKAADRVAHLMDKDHTDVTVCSRRNAGKLDGNVIELPD